MKIIVLFYDRQLDWMQESIVCSCVDIFNLPGGNIFLLCYTNLNKR